jgi:hypothetical protein
MQKKEQSKPYKTYDTYYTHPPKSPIFELNASSGNQWGGAYFAMIEWQASGFGDIVARWHVLCVPLSR